jgi:hypothetical protein
VLQSERSTILTLNAMKLTTTGRYEDAGTAVVKFRRCVATKFGLPNDEALPGHPLAGHGLRAYGCYEVLESPWLAEAEAQNRVSFPSSDWLRDMRHFILTFHDTSFECLARDFDVRTVDDFRPAYNAIVDRLYNE